MKNLLTYNSNDSYLGDKPMWNYNRPNVCRIENYDKYGSRKIIFNCEKKLNHLYRILWVNISNPNETIITTNILTPDKGYKPIALNLIPQDFLSDPLHDAPYTPSRWMSLKYMYFDDMNTTETGTQPYIENAKYGSLINYGMTLDEPTLYQPQLSSPYTQEQLSTSRYTTSGVNLTFDDIFYNDNYSGVIEYAGDGMYSYNNNIYISIDSTRRGSSQLSKTCSGAYAYAIIDKYDSNDQTNAHYNTSNETIGYKQSNSIIKSVSAIPNQLFYEDELRGWNKTAVDNSINSTDFKILPSLYTENNKWIVTEYPNEFMYHKSYGTNAGSDFYCALSYVRGKALSHDIISYYENASPSIPINVNNVTYVGKCKYTTRLQQLKPFYCCSQYRTLGTEPGDWYLPSIGELVFILYDVDYINAKLHEIHLLYPNDCINGLNSTWYWSSTNYSAQNYCMWIINPGTGQITGLGDYGSRNTTLAFLLYDEDFNEVLKGY